MAVHSRPPHDSDEFFAEIETLIVEGRSAEAYEYKVQWYPFVMGQMNKVELDRLTNIDTEFYLTGHIPSARQRSRFPEVLDPRLESDHSGASAGALHGDTKTS